jgi:hypothetical protein
MLFESLLSKYLEALPMHDNRQTSIEAIRDAITSHGHAMFWKAQKGISGVWECRSRGKYLGQPATAFCLRLTDDGWYVGTYSYRSFVLPKHIDAIAACLTMLNSENVDVANIPAVVIHNLGLRETEEWLSPTERTPPVRSH